MHPNFKPEPFIEAEGLQGSHTTPFCLQHYIEIYIVSMLLDYLVSEYLTTTPLGQIRLGNKEQLNGTRSFYNRQPGYGLIARCNENKRV